MLGVVRRWCGRPLRPGRRLTAPFVRALAWEASAGKAPSWAIRAWADATGRAPPGPSDPACWYGVESVADPEAGRRSRTPSPKQPKQELEPAKKDRKKRNGKKKRPKGPLARGKTLRQGDAEQADIDGCVPVSVEDDYRMQEDAEEEEESAVSEGSVASRSEEAGSLPESSPLEARRPGEGGGRGGGRGGDGTSFRWCGNHGISNTGSLWGTPRVQGRPTGMGQLRQFRALCQGAGNTVAAI